MFMGRKERRMMEYGYDISDLKAFTDESLSVEIPIESVPKDALEKILGGVAIIRCKDCKHWYFDADTGKACEFTNLGQPEDGFCNWAERKEK